MKEEALRVLLEGRAKVRRSGGPVMRRERAARLVQVDDGRVRIRGALTASDREQEADRRRRERASHEPEIS